MNAMIDRMGGLTSMGIGIGGSLAFHLLILVLFLSLHGCESKGPVTVPAPVPPVERSTVEQPMEPSGVEAPPAEPPPPAAPKQASRPVKSDTSEVTRAKRQTGGVQDAKIEVKGGVKSDEKETVPPAGDTAKPAVRSYKVKSGDNLTRLARESGVTIQELARLNGVSLKVLSDLKIGQTIKLPVSAEK